jgi:hypothetical protein
MTDYGVLGNLLVIFSVSIAVVFVFISSGFHPSPASWWLVH